MKVAIVGSRNLHVENLEKYLPKNTTEIVSGGARGIDSDARAYQFQQFTIHLIAAVAVNAVYQLFY